ncbi:MAG: hypothetical protein JKY00_11625, partial [Roseicyclus sp.]|nr:hypothetical protein [Roseicyclus sp.]
MKPKARKFRIRRSDAVAPAGETRRAEALDAREAAAQAPQQRRPAPAPEPQVEDTSLPNITEDGFGDMAIPGSAAHDRVQAEARSGAPAGTQARAPAGAPAGAPASAGTPETTGNSVEAELAAIRSEGLTGRQLRMARRAAQKHGLHPSSDFDAVRQLRKRGFDPFGQSNMLELVVSGSQGAAAGAAPGAASGAATGNTLPVRA